MSGLKLGRSIKSIQFFPLVFKFKTLKSNYFQKLVSLILLHAYEFSKKEQNKIKKNKTIFPGDYDIK